MNAKLVTLALIVSACAIPSVASAQHVHRHHHGSHYHGSHYYGSNGPAYGGYGYGYGNYHHASTLEEGMLNGYANVIQAWGVNNLLSSQAARNYEEAYSRDLDNRVKRAETYVEVKRIKREYAASLRVPSPTPEKAASYAKARAPERLTYRDLDPMTGRIEWPAALEGEAFDAQRDKLEELAYKWAKYNGLSGADHIALQQTAKAMQAELKGRIKDFSMADYVAAKNLLESLCYEVARKESDLAKEESGSLAAK